MRELIFNGVDMSNFFRITDIIRPIGNTRSITTDDAPAIGVNIQTVKRGAKIHTIKFDMRAGTPLEMEQLKHALAGVLDVLEPVKIIYGDEPDKYYMGLPVDDVTTDNIARWFQRSELKFLIPDGVAHSANYRKFDSSIDATVSSDRIVFKLENNGTAPAYPIITVKHNAENGYVGLVNQNGAFEVGNREEADTKTVKQSEMLFDYRDSKITSALNQPIEKVMKNFAVLNDMSARLVGQLGVDNSWGRPHIHLTSRGSGSSQGYRAASISFKIPPDSAGGIGSLNDYIWWRQIFWVGAANQLGFIKVTVSDAQGQFLYGVETIKLSNGLTTQYNFFATDGKGGYRILKRWEFTATHEDKHNPFNQNRGWCDLKRNDDKVQVYYWGSYPVITVPELRGRKSATVHVAFGAVGDRPLVTHMYLDSIYYRKDFVSVTKDIPNRFPIGSTIVADSENDMLYVDGANKAKEVVDGSQFISIPPGKSDLEVYVSSFVRNKPTVKVEFEERWL